MQETDTKIINSKPKAYEAVVQGEEEQKQHNPEFIIDEETGKQKQYEYSGKESNDVEIHDELQSAVTITRQPKQEGSKEIFSKRFLKLNLGYVMKYFLFFQKQNIIILTSIISVIVIGVFVDTYVGYSKKCGVNQYLSNQNKCVNCNPTCGTCQNQTSCESCAKDFFMQLDKKTCSPQCKNNEILLNNSCLCPTGYSLNLLNETYICTKCSSNCGICEESSACIQCLKGFALFNNSCNKCHDQNCETCDQQLQCALCNNGYYLNEDDFSCITSCKDNQYRRDTKCFNCPQGCSQCLSQSNCLNCAQGYQLQSTGQCTTCVIGQYQRDGKCYKCQQDCLSCADELSCSSCLVGLFLLGNGTCQTSCPTVTYASNYNCFNCTADCLSCESQYQCKECSKSKFLSKGFCVDQCQQNEFKIGQTCYSCQSSCQTCENNLTCSTCPEGQLKGLTGLCVLNCASQEYSQNGQCYQCQKGCQSCSNYETCNVCENEWAMSSNQTCLILNCDPKQYIQNNSCVSCQQEYQTVCQNCNEKGCIISNLPSNMTQIVNLPSLDHLELQLVRQNFLKYNPLEQLQKLSTLINFSLDCKQKQNFMFQYLKRECNFGDLRSMDILKKQKNLVNLKIAIKNDYINDLSPLQTIEDLYSLENIYFDFQQNSLTSLDTLPIFTNQANLKQLYLGFDSFQVQTSISSISGLESIFSCYSLQQLDLVLSSNQIVDITMFNSISNLKKLTRISIDLTGNQINNIDFVRQLSQLQNLIQLSLCLEGNLITSIDQLQNLSSLQQLQEFNITLDSLTLDSMQPLEFLQTLPAIQNIQISQQQFYHFYEGQINISSKSLKFKVSKNFNLESFSASKDVAFDSTLAVNLKNLGWSLQYFNC